MQVSSPHQLITNKEAYAKTIKNSFILNEIGAAIKTRRFPIVMKKLHLSKIERTQNEEHKKVLPMLKLADDTFKTLPSLRNSSYQTYRQSSNLLKDYQVKTELPFSKLAWGPETVITGPGLYEVEKPRRTQIQYIEQLYPSKPLKQAESISLSPPPPPSFLAIYERIKKRSEARASLEYFSSRGSH
jgi:hypothetical protein